MSQRRTASQVTTRTPGSHQPDKSVISLSAGELRELIAKRAYEFYEQRGDGYGDELSDWVRAEADIVAGLLAEPLDVADTDRVVTTVPAGAKSRGRTVTSVSGARKRASSPSRRKDKPKGILA